MWAFFPPRDYTQQKHRGPLAYMVTCLSTLNPLFILIKYWTYQNPGDVITSITLVFCSLSYKVVTGANPGGMDCIWGLSATLHVLKASSHKCGSKSHVLQTKHKNVHNHCILHFQECIMEWGGNYFQGNYLNKYMEKRCIFPKTPDIKQFFQYWTFSRTHNFFYGIL